MFKLLKTENAARAEKRLDLRCDCKSDCKSRGACLALLNARGARVSNSSVVLTAEIAMSVEKPLITTPEPLPAPPFEPSQGPDGTKEIHEHEDQETDDSSEG
jgi:hypothetical protein